MPADCTAVVPEGHTAVVPVELIGLAEPVVPVVPVGLAALAEQAVPVELAALAEQAARVVPVELEKREPHYPYFGSPV
ncbi:MAG: hypothetical protein ACOYCA_02490 [Eggerthellaceae bacterium]